MSHESEEAFKILDAAAQKQERIAFVPCINLEGTGLSHFGGMPWLQEGESWPVCKICGNRMPLWLQLVAEDVPELARPMLDSGLLQWFRCLGHPGIGRLIQIRRSDPELVNSYYVKGLDDVVEDIGEEAAHRLMQEGETVSEEWWEELELDPELTGNAFFFSTGDCGFLAADDSGSSSFQCIRIIDRDGPAREIMIDEVPVDTFGPFYITAWAEAVDRPVLDDLDIEHFWEYRDRLSKPASEEVFEWNLHLDKLGGWPTWLQGTPFEECPQCGAEFEQFVFEIAENGRSITPWEYNGLIYVVQCPNHPRELRAIAQFS